MNTAVRRNASVMTRNFCISAQGGPVLDQESSWNFNQVTNQTENINMETGVQTWEQQANHFSLQYRTNSTSTCPFCGGPIARQILGQIADEILSQIFRKIPSEL
ncbi:hypothetical protein ABFA07_018261 [Porites harrisoni]